MTEEILTEEEVKKAKLTPRMASVMSYDVENNNIVIFGGSCL